MFLAAVHISRIQQVISFCFFAREDLDSPVNLVVIYFAREFNTIGGNLDNLVISFAWENLDSPVNL